MPILSQTGIVNLALREIGEFRINDINEDSPPAEVARDLFDNIKRRCLQAHDWRFAMKQAELASIDEDVLLEFSTAWQMPADMVRLSRICENTTMDPPLTEFSVVGRKILTSTVNLFIEYVYDAPVISEWPDYFASYMSAVLASEMAPAIKSASERERLEKLMMLRLPQARSLDSQQQPVIIVHPSRWLTSMRGRVSWWS